MKQRNILLTRFAAVTVALLTSGSALASTFVGVLPAGYSDSVFQISQGTSTVTINISATGGRDPTICATCNTTYTDNFIVNLFDKSGTLLKSANEINFLYYNMFSSSHGSGAMPVGVAVPQGAATFEIVSQLFISGMLGPDGRPLSFGNLNISTDGTITAATPIPSTLPLLATGLATLLGLFSRRKKREAIAVA